MDVGPVRYSVEYTTYQQYARGRRREGTERIPCCARDKNKQQAMPIASFDRPDRRRVPGS
jgi:hypothetical protein